MVHWCVTTLQPGAASWSWMAIAAWSQSVVMLNLNAWAMVVDVHWLYKTHIFLGLLITILFPFTRLVHIFSGFAAPVRYLLARPGYQIVRSRRQTPLPPRSTRSTPAE